MPFRKDNHKARSVSANLLLFADIIPSSNRFPRPSLKVHTIADFERGKATSDRSIVICAVNTYTEKSSLLPMVVVNELWKRNPDSFDKVWVVTKKDTFKKNTTGGKWNGPNHQTSIESVLWTLRRFFIYQRTFGASSFYRGLKYSGGLMKKPIFRGGQRLKGCLKSRTYFILSSK